MPRLRVSGQALVGGVDVVGADLGGPRAAGLALGGVAQALGHRDPHQHRLALHEVVQGGAGRRVPGHLPVGGAGVASTASMSRASGRMWKSMSKSALQTSCTR